MLADVPGHGNGQVVVVIEYRSKPGLLTAAEQGKPGAQSAAYAVERIAGAAAVSAGVLRQPPVAGHRRHRGPVDHQPAQNVAGTPAGSRPAWRRQPRGVVGDHFPRARDCCAAVTRNPYLRARRVPDNGHIGHLADRRIQILPQLATAWTPCGTIGEQVAEHRGHLATHGGVGDRHPQFHGPHDRVGDNRGRRLQQQGSPVLPVTENADDGVTVNAMGFRADWGPSSAW